LTDIQQGSILDRLGRASDNEEESMRRPGKWAALVAAVTMASGATVALVAGASAGSQQQQGPIVIGAAMDLTANMSPYDTPALYAVQSQVKKINAAGGVVGRQLQVRVCDHQLKKQKACALQLIRQGAQIGMVTCDVEYAAPATQAFIASGRLALAPCIGTDQQGPKRFGPRGRLAFTLGNIAQDEGAAMAEYSYKRGWRTAIIVQDNLLAYFRDIGAAFKVRFQQLGGRIVQEESFTSFSNTINNALGRVSRTRADVIVFPTAFDGLAPFVGGLRSLGNETPIINSWGGDGNYWWPKDPKVTNYYYVTYGSIFGDDPNRTVNALVRQVRALNKGRLPATGSFIPGADLVDALVAAIKRTNGSTSGVRLAAQFEKFKRFPVTSGRITYSKSVHGVTGRAYRVMLVNDNRARFQRFWRTAKPANIG
jgi:branched-chain amino acid transport system substrate-binding protein